MYTIAKIDLGMTRAEFRASTPRIFRALVNRRRELLRRLDYPAAIVAATVANVNGRKDGQPFTPEDFMPDPPPKRAPQKMDWRHMLAIVEQANAKLGGDDLRQATNEQ